MIQFKRNKETGKLEVWKNGKKTGEIDTMGDEVINNGGGIPQQSGSSLDGKRGGNRKGR